jgi:hypothetical protein
MDVAGGEELRQVGGVDQIAEADPAGRAAGGEPLEGGAFSASAGDDHGHVVRQQGRGGDEDLQTLLPAEVAGVHRHRRLRADAPGDTEAVGTGPRAHAAIIDPVGEQGNRASPGGLGADLAAHRRRDGRHQVDVAEDQPLARQQQAGEGPRHHAELDRGIDLQVLHMVDHRHAPAQAQPQAEQADEEGRGDEHDGVGPFAGPQAAPGDRRQPAEIESHARQARGRWRRDEMPDAFHRHAVDELVAAPAAVVAGGVRVRHAPPRIVRQARAHGHLPAPPPREPAAHAGVVVRDPGRLRPVVVGIDGYAHVGLPLTAGG